MNDFEKRHWHWLFIKFFCLIELMSGMWHLPLDKRYCEWAFSALRFTQIFTKVWTNFLDVDGVNKHKFNLRCKKKNSIMKILSARNKLENFNYNKFWQTIILFEGIIHVNTLSLIVRRELHVRKPLNIFDDERKNAKLLHN